MQGGFSTGASIPVGYVNKIKPAKITGAKKQARKEPKMNFIKRKLRDWIMRDEAVCVSVEDDSGLDIDRHEAMNFNVVNAAGGRIVQVRYYDRKTDRQYNKLHIITPEEDLAESLAHILAIETMSR